MKHSVDRLKIFGNVMTLRSGRVKFPAIKINGVRDLGVRKAPSPSSSWSKQSLAPFLLPNRAERMGPMLGQTQPKERSVGSIRINVTPEEIINQDNAVRIVERQAALLQMVHWRVLSLCN